VGTAVYKKVDAHDVKTTLTKSRQPELSTDEFTEQVAAIADELTALVEGRQSDSSSDTGATDAGLTGAEVLEFVDTVIENAENLVDLSVGASDGSTADATELQEEIMEKQWATPKMVTCPKGQLGRPLPSSNKLSKLPPRWLRQLSILGQMRISKRLL